MRVFLTIQIIYLLMADAFSQHTAWHYHSPNRGISDLKFYQDTLWIGSWGYGLTALDVTNNSKRHFLKNNSGITDAYPSEIEIDTLGRKWIGLSGSTQFWWGGINIYDGNNWEQWYSGNGKCPLDKVASIEIDMNNNIWVCNSLYGEKLWRHDGISWSYFDTTNSPILKGDINDLLAIKKGKVYVAVYDNKLVEYDIATDTWSDFDTIFQSFRLKDVLCMTEDENGTLWLANVAGVFSYDGNIWNRITSPFGAEASDIVIDTAGKIWLAGRTRGVAMYNGNVWTIYDSTNSVLNDYGVGELELDPVRNHVYAGNYGLFKFDGVSWTSINIDDSECIIDYGNSVIVKDSDNVIAINRVVSVYDGSNWNNFIPPLINYTDHDYINESRGVIDIYGNAWYGINAQDGGLMKFDGTSFTLYHLYQGLSFNNSIVAIGADKAGNIWATSFLDVAFKFNVMDETIETFYDKDIGWAKFIFEDRDGNIFFGGRSGITKFDGANWIKIKTDSLPVYRFYEMDQDINGNYWFATYYAGLFKYDGTKFTIYNTSNSGLYDDWLRTVKTDIYGNVWVSGWNNQGGGLQKFDGINWTSYDVANSGLLQAYITDIDVDENGCVWLSTHGAGINVFCCPNPSPNPFDSVYFFCPDGDITLSFPQQSGTEYLWSNGSTDNYTSFSDTGLVWLYVKDKDGCSQTHKTFIKHYPATITNIPADTFVCSESSLILSVDSIYTNVVWSDGSQDYQTIIIEQGSYSVSFTDTNGCNNQFEFIVREKLPPFIGLGDDVDSICSPPYVISADSSDYNYLWSTGDTAHFTNVFDSGLYSLTVSNACGSYNDSVRITFFDESLLKIYTTFSPDGDGIHDVFYIPPSYGYIFYDLKIYDLTGSMVFQTNDINTGWDGTYNGNPVPSGAYVYELTVLCDNYPIIKRGTLMVLL